MSSDEAYAMDPILDIQLSQHGVNVKVTTKRAKKCPIQPAKLRRSARVCMRTFQGTKP